MKLAKVSVTFQVPSEEAKVYRFALKRFRAGQEDEPEARAIIVEMLAKWAEAIKYAQETAGANVR